LVFHPIHLSIGVSLSVPNSPVPSPSAPKADLTPSKRPMFRDMAVLEEEAGTKACAHEAVAAAAIIDVDFIVLFKYT